MNADVFLKIINGQYKPSIQVLRAIDNVLSQSPWCSIAQQLSAVEAKKISDDSYKNRLHLAAVYSLRRDKLFDKISAENDGILVFEPDKDDGETFDYPIADYFVGETTKEKQTNESLINDFLNSPQTIIVSDAENENEPVPIIADFDAQNADNDGDIATETLAKIYAEQGYFSRAIAIYEKLSLQDSKKSAYFAALIENLKKRKINKD